jgi:hypothetical protein
MRPLAGSVESVTRHGWLSVALSRTSPRRTGCVLAGSYAFPTRTDVQVTARHSPVMTRPIAENLSGVTNR